VVKSRQSTPHRKPNSDNINKLWMSSNYQSERTK